MQRGLAGMPRVILGSMISSPRLHKSNIKSAHSKFFGEDAVVRIAPDDAPLESIPTNDRTERILATLIISSDLRVRASEQGSATTCTCSLQIEKSV